MKAEKRFWVVKSIALAGVLCAGLSACKGVDEEITTTGATTNPTTGVNDGYDFSVVVDPEGKQYSYWVHDASDTTTYSTPCRITESSANKDVTCMIEAKELDLAYWGAALTYNVPPQMCTYFIVEPYYFYWNRAGTGPDAITYDIDQNGATGVDLNSDGDVDDANERGSIASDLNGDDDFGDVGELNGGAVYMHLGLPRCFHDYSVVTGGPNCCVGNYSATVRTWDRGTSQYVTDTENAIWGGNPLNCLAGPAMKDKLSNGVPITEIQYVEGVGVRATYNLKASGDNTVSGHTTKFANYYDPADHPMFGEPLGFRTPPAAGAIAPNPNYVFTCFDRAFETKARITVKIREWNVSEEWDLKGSGDSEAGLPGEDEAPPFEDTDLNDMQDWADRTVEVAPGVFVESFPGGSIW